MKSKYSDLGYPVKTSSTYEQQIVPFKRYKYREDYFHVSSSTFILTTHHLNRNIFVSLVNNSVNLILPDIKLCTGGMITIQVDVTHPTRTLTISPNSVGQSIYAHNQSGYVNLSGNFVTTNPTVGSRYDLFCNGKNWVNSHIDSKQEVLTIDGTGQTTITLDNRYNNMVTKLIYTTGSAIEQDIFLPDPANYSNARFHIVTVSNVYSTGVYAISFKVPSNNSLVPKFEGQLYVNLVGVPGVAQTSNGSPPSATTPSSVPSITFNCGSYNDSLNITFEAIGGVYHISGSIVSSLATIQTPSIPEMFIPSLVAPLYMPLAGGTFLGDVSFGGNKHVTNMTNGVSSGDAATMNNLSSYLTISSASSTYLALSGGSMTGTGTGIDMGNSNLTSTGTGSILFNNPASDFRYGNFRIKSTGTKFYIYNNSVSNYLTDYCLMTDVSGSVVTHLNVTDTGTISLLRNGSTRLSITTSGIVLNSPIFTNIVLPNLDNTYTIGDGTHIYTTIYGNAINSSSFKIDSTLEANSLTIGQVSNYTLAKCALRQTSGGKTFINCASGQTVVHSVGGTSVVETSSTAFFPSTDSDGVNGINLGTSSNKWTTVYATTGTINTSDINLKTAIQPLSKVEYSDKIVKFINGLTPVSYQWKSEPVSSSTKTHTGFIAQDVEKLRNDTGFLENDIVNKEIGENNKENWGMKYAEFIAPIVIYIQKLNERIVLLNNQVTILEAKNKK